MQLAQAAAAVQVASPGRGAEDFIAVEAGRTYKPPLPNFLCISEGQPFSHRLARRLLDTGRFKFNRASGFGSSTNKENEALAMIKTKTIVPALALTGVTGCEAADPFNPFNPFGQDYYKFGAGRPPNTQPFSSHPQPDGPCRGTQVRG